MMGFFPFLCKLCLIIYQKNGKRLICPGFMTITWLPMSDCVPFAERDEMFGKEDLHSLKVSEVQ